MAEERFLSIPLNEQETTISFSRDSEQVDIWTNDRTMITKLDKLCKSSPAMYRCKHVGYSMGEHEVMDKQYVCSDKSLLSFKPKKRQCAPLTDEQKAERVQRLRALQEPMGCGDCIHYSYCMERRGICTEYKTLSEVRKEIEMRNKEARTSATAEGDNEAGPR